jgi:uncharacterized YccA/Bax inhibitor family protein
MKMYALMYFTGLFLLGTGIGVAIHSAAPIPIVFGSGCILAALFEYMRDRS